MKKIISILIALVWLANGLFCKILNFEPRHQEIVGQILGNQYKFPFTITIGILECLMFFWVLSKIKSNFCAVFQIVIIMTMNVLEFILVPNLLLFGRFNIFVAIAFCPVNYWTKSNSYQNIKPTKKQQIGHQNKF